MIFEHKTLDEIYLQGCSVVFVAMEYWAGALNRTYLVFAKENHLSGIIVRGVSAAPLTKTAIAQWFNIHFYLSKRIIAKYSKVNLGSKEILQCNPANFRIPKASIERLDWDGTEKWGMGTVPHTGKINVYFKNGRKREFILLGSQNGLRTTSDLNRFLN